MTTMTTRDTSLDVTKRTQPRDRFNAFILRWLVVRAPLLSALLLVGGCTDKPQQFSEAKSTETPTWLAASDYVRGEMPGIASDVNVYLLADELSDRYIDYKGFRLRKPLPFISGPINCETNLIADVFSAVADFRYTEPLAKTGEYGIGFPSWNCAIVTTNARVETTLLVMFHPGFECIGVMTNDQFIGLVSARKEIETAVENLQKAVCPEYQAPPH